jgi:hypothetical protein
VIIEHGPVSQNDVWRILSEGKDRPPMLSTITTRVPELEHKGLIKAVGRREDPVTGRNNTIYEATGNIAAPGRIERPKSVRTLLREALRKIDQLEKANRDLIAKLDRLGRPTNAERIAKRIDPEAPTLFPDLPDGHPRS